MKKTRNLKLKILKNSSYITIITFVIILTLSLNVSAKPNPGHTADQISGGTFDDGDGAFVFPDGEDVTMNTDTFHVDSQDSQVGIGTIIPDYLLHVDGNSYFTGVTYLGDTGSYFDTDGNLIMNQMSEIQLDTSSTKIWASADATENLWMTAAGYIRMNPSGDVVIQDDDLLLFTGGVCTSDVASCSDPGDGNLMAYQDVYVGYGDSSDDDYIYFDGGTTEYFMRADATDRFQLSGDLSVGYDSDSDNDIIYFDQGSAQFGWDNANSRFASSHDLYVGSSSSNDDDRLLFDDGTEYFMWDESESAFTLTDGLIRFYSTASDTNISVISASNAGLVLSADIAKNDPSLNPHLVFQKNGGGTIATIGGEGTDTNLFFINSTDDIIIAPGNNDYVNIVSTSTPLRVESSYDGDQAIMDLCSTDLNTDDEYARINFRVDSSCSTQAASIDFVMENVTASTEDSEIVFQTMGGGARSEAGRFTNSNDLIIQETLAVGNSASDDDDYIYFDQGSEYIYWDESQGRFYISDDLYVAGNITLPTSQNLELSDGTMYICSSGCNPENIDYATADGDLFIEGDIESEGVIYADYIRSMGSMYLNYDGSDGDSNLYFYDSSSTIGEYIGWDDSLDRFYFSDDVYVGGALSKSSGSFLIDHPLDPYNKILRHSFVESPEMLNIYKGNSKTVNNQKTITMPDWFVALNGQDKDDYSFTITSLNSFCGDYFIDNSKIAVDGTFTVNTEKECEFSWVAYAVRHDDYALENPIIVEETKESAGFPVGELLKDVNNK